MRTSDFLNFEGMVLCILISKTFDPNSLWSCFCENKSLSRSIYSIYGGFFFSFSPSFSKVTELWNYQYSDANFLKAVLVALALDRLHMTVIHAQLCSPFLFRDSAHVDHSITLSCSSQTYYVVQTNLNKKTMALVE